METITSIAPLIPIIAAIFTIPKSLHILHEHKRKKFKAELETYEEYFTKYYDKDSSKNIPMLIQDKAAQNLTRSKLVNFRLINYFISLHENLALSFDEAIDHFCWGNRFITVSEDRKNHKFSFSQKNKTPKLFQIINYCGYVVFLVFALGLLSGFIPYLNNMVLSVVIGISSLIVSIQCLKNADDISESMRFLAIIEMAQTHQTGELIDKEIN